MTMLQFNYMLFVNSILLLCPVIIAQDYTLKTLSHESQIDELSGRECALAIWNQTDLDGSPLLDVEDLRVCLKKCQLEKLVIFGTPLDDKWISEVSCEDTLVTLSMTGMDRVTSIQPLRQLSSLDNLSMHAMSFTSGALESLADFTTLRTLNVSGEDGKGGAPYSALSSSLESLSLSGHWLSISVLESVQDSLTSLALAGVEIVVGEGCKSMELSSLTSLTLRGDLSVASAVKLKMPALESLCANSCDMDGVVLSDMSPRCCLRTLRLQKCSNLAARQLLSLSMQPLTELAVTHTYGIGNAHLDAISHLHELECLKLSHLAAASVEKLGMIGELEFEVLALTNSTCLSDSGVEAALQSKLNEIDLSWNPHLSKRVLQCISQRAPNITVLKLEGCVGITSIKLADVRDMNRIEHIDLSDTYSDDATLAVMAEIPVKDVDFGRTLLTIGGIRIFSKLAYSVEKLIFTGCPNISKKDLQVAAKLLPEVEVVG